MVPQETYLGAGIHIGTRNKSGGMRPFIYKARDDGLHVLDLRKMDERLRSAARLLAEYPEVVVYFVSNKENAKAPIRKAAELLGVVPLIGRFTPGRFTNPARSNFSEPGIILVVDPNADKQAVKEAHELNVPVIALCDTNNVTKYVDLIIPTNNKGRKALALIFWLLSREILKAKGKISSDAEFTAKPEEFEAS